MARTTAQVDGSTLVIAANDTNPITVGTDAWFAWLETATAFVFTSPSGRFTARKERRETAKLSPIVPLVVYHGRAQRAPRWSYARRFDAMFKTSKDVRKYLPAFEHELLDLPALPDEAIQGEVMVRVVQLVLKHIFAEDLGARLPAILGVATEFSNKPVGWRCW